MIQRLKNGLYDVPSASGDHCYVCDPKAVTCTCSDFQYRRREYQTDDPERRCKHLLQVENHLAEQTELARMAERAAHLSDEDLMRFARARNGDAVGAACWIELASRKQHQDRDVEMKELFR